MIEESKRHEYWNFLTTEKNQPRPKGITVQRLAVIKEAIINRAEMWTNVIGREGVEVLPATDFYQKNEPDSLRSRTLFWDEVRSVILEQENRRSRKVHSSTHNRKVSPKRQTENVVGNNRRGRF